MNGKVDRVGKAGDRAFVIANVAVDETCAVEALPRRGESVIGRFVMRDPGGKGANVATVLARAGVATTLVAAVGEDERGEFVRARLAAEQSAGAPLRASLVSVPGLPTDVSHVYTTPGGDNAIVTTVAAAHALEPEHARQALGSARAGDLVVLQGNLSKGTTLASIGLARGRGLVVALNPSPMAPWLPEAIAQVQIVFANQDEAEALTGAHGEAAVRALLAAGPDQAVVTRGGAGAWLGSRVGGDGASRSVRIESLPAEPVEVVDTTGAGDTFMAVSLARALRRHTPLDRDALTCAMRAAALTVARRGTATAFPSREELGRLLG